MIFGKSKILGWIFRHKLTCALLIALLGFFISTVVLILLKNETESKLITCIADKNATPPSPQTSTSTLEPTEETTEGTTLETTPEPITETTEEITQEPITETTLETTEITTETTEETTETTETIPETTEETTPETTQETTAEPITETIPDTTLETTPETTEITPATTEETTETTQETTEGTTEETTETTGTTPETTEEITEITSETTEGTTEATPEPITETTEETTETTPETTEEITEITSETTEGTTETTPEPITETTEETTQETTEETTPETTEETTTETTEETTPETTPEPTTETTEEGTTEPITSTTEIPTTTESPLPILRLSPDVIPITYDLYLHPQLYNEDNPEILFTYTGTNSILISVLSPTKEISLHSNGLEISHVTLFSESGDEIVFISDILPEHELIILNAEEPVEIGNYIINIEFSGDMTNRIVGLYSSSYLNEFGVTTHIATSKFEPTYARQAFPCFDEPAMKANFTISLVIPNRDNYMALSNMDVESNETIAGDLVVVHFKESVKMSTYLACFIVSDFVAQTSEVAALGNSTTFPMSVYATPAQINKTEFALDTGINITKFYIEYFQIDYPLPKLDMVAIPDFVSGAMEHWGLVTFRETSLLFDPLSSSTLNKQRVATVVAHELAHMWFGNLVTMLWWNDLWLNEGFASYIEAKGTDFVYPEWGMMDQFIIDDLHPVMITDATLASHPIVQVAESPDQITELFDSITYSKGASIIRMLENFVGIEHFRNAVTNYLNEHAFGNAVTDDLLTQIDIGLTIDVKDIMATWTEQMGFPLVTVERISSTQYRLTQERFLSNPDSYNESWSNSDYNYKWTIPITYFTDVDPLNGIEWFKREDTEVLLNVSDSHNWIKLNNDQIGYYRINYPTSVWDNFTSALLEDVTVLSISNRAHLLNDAFSLADATILDYSTALNLMNYLRNETEYVPWSVAASKLASLKNILYDTDLYPKFMLYVQALIQSAYQTVDWQSSSQENAQHLRNHLRTTIFGIAASFELPSCVNEVTRRFNDWINNENDDRPIPDLRNVIYYYGMEYAGNQPEWDRLWELYKNEADASEKIKLMNALAAVQSPSILQSFIELAWNESNVRGQDYFSCLIYIAQNRIGEPLIWNYVRDNWEQLVERFGLNERYLGNMIPSITSRFSTQSRLEEMKEFFNKHPNAGAGAAARLRALDTVQYNINWLSKNKIKVENWLNENSS